MRLEMKGMLKQIDYNYYGITKEIHFFHKKFWNLCKISKDDGCTDSRENKIYKVKYPAGCQTEENKDKQECENY